MSNWRKKDNFINIIPGCSDVMSIDRFLAIWSFFHCVDEADLQLDKTDKYTRHVQFSTTLSTSLYTTLPLGVNCLWMRE